MFDPNSTVPNIIAKQGTVEDWIIENRSNELHAFHIHQLHFTLLDYAGTPVNEGTYLHGTQSTFLTITAERFRTRVSSSASTFAIRTSWARLCTTAICSSTKTKGHDGDDSGGSNKTAGRASAKAEAPGRRRDPSPSMQLAAGGETRTSGQH